MKKNTRSTEQRNPLTKYVRSINNFHNTRIFGEKIAQLLTCCWENKKLKISKHLHEHFFIFLWPYQEDTMIFRYPESSVSSRLRYSGDYTTFGDFHNNDEKGRTAPKQQRQTLSGSPPLSG